MPTNPPKIIREPNQYSKVGRHILLWGTASAGFATFLYADGEGGEGEVGVINTAVGAIISVLVACGVLIYRKIKLRDSYYKRFTDKDDINNPWNARVKAGVVFGEGIGRTFLGCLPIPLPEKPLLILGGAIGGFFGGLIALFIPEWEPKVGKSLQTPELNPVSERIRSGAMYGSCFGIVLGVLFILVPGVWNISSFILLGSGVGAAVGGGLAYLFNEKDFPERSSDSTFKNQNPWSKRIRAGIQWAACLGMLIGVLFPGLGLGLSAVSSVVVGGALFSILGGFVSLIAEPLFTLPTTKGLFDKDYETANPWGPRCRAGVAFGTCVGILIGCTLFPGFVGATAGGAIAGLVGGFIAVVFEPLYLQIKYWFNEKKADYAYEEVDSGDPVYTLDNPWSERCRTGTLVCGALGALIGYFIFPPLGLFFGSAIGGIIGGVGAFILPSREIAAVEVKEEDVVLSQPLINSCDDNVGYTEENNFETYPSPLNGDSTKNNQQLSKARPAITTASSITSEQTPPSRNY